jgi:Uma2 family endonuclease
MAHNQIANRIHRSLLQVIPDDWGIYQTLDAALPSRNGLFIPDLAVAPEAALDAESEHFIPVAAAELIMEITSPSNATVDRITKAAAYAAAGVPLYLLVDRWAPGGPTVMLYGEPKGDVYRVLSAGKFGGVIRIPRPFDLDLDTGLFPDGSRSESDG